MAMAMGMLDPHYFLGRAGTHDPSVIRLLRPSLGKGDWVNFHLLVATSHHKHRHFSHIIRAEILGWINDTLSLRLQKVEDTHNGQYFVTRHYQLLLQFSSGRRENRTGPDQQFFP